MPKSTNNPDIVCLSHLRWDFVYQRPQHLMSRFARDHRIFFIEEPVFGKWPPHSTLTLREGGVQIFVPHLTEDVCSTFNAEAMLKELLNSLLVEQAVHEFVLWYYTPMAVEWTRHLKPLASVYDCMGELSAFRGAPRELRERERELFNLTDLVFTGGQSLYEAKRDLHPAVYAFPSSIDVRHFVQARSISFDPEDQAPIPRPRLGFFGVIDERLDTELLDAVAAARPDWHLVIVGPVIKIDPDTLPRRANIHYLGGKSYQELPAYIASWDVAMIPFARNESTRFISPTKTPEYLAAGRPVVSTSIHDVIHPYGERGLVRIADSPQEFVAAIERAMREHTSGSIQIVDDFLGQTSWDKTWGRMNELLEDVITAHQALSRKPS